MTIGQYLQPTRMHLPVVEFIDPAVFQQYKIIGEAKGIDHVESGPLVRSSYHAERHV
jgi:lipoic acid synthetase